MIDLSFLKGQRVAVMGLGKSGRASAHALLQAGVEVAAWDDGEAARQAAAAAGIPLLDLHAADFSQIDVLVWSPGVPHTFPQPNPVATRARAAGVEPVCDVDLLGRAAPCAQYVGITGTNGKSTTTALIGHILEADKRRTQVGGNLGIPVLTFDQLGERGVYVLELSSYQLELTRSVTHAAAVLLNITPDHLDRHGGMAGYIAAKKLIFAGQSAAHTAIIGLDDEHCRALCGELMAAGHQRLWPISAERTAPGGVYVRGDQLIDDTRGLTEPVLDLTTLPTLLGTHNRQNAAAAYAACRALRVPRPVIAEAMATFPGLAHRQQSAGAINGVRFINDSKATNADAAAKALATFEPIYWILGGQAKETGLDGLEQYLPRVRRAFLIGEATERFAAWLEERGVAFDRCGTIDKAVETAANAAFADRLAGATVLLSPACASWDQFANFEKRGEAFIEAVKHLTPAAGGAP
jgi:UDP-N-acetylmuramoylalanine--D-glutamate ligase